MVTWTVASGRQTSPTVRPAMTKTQHCQVAPPAKSTPHSVILVQVVRLSCRYFVVIISFRIKLPTSVAYCTKMLRSLFYWRRLSQVPKMRFPGERPGKMDRAVITDRGPDYKSDQLYGEP